MATVGDVYRFEVAARTVVGDGTRSSTVAAAVASLPSKPGAPPSANYAKSETGLFVNLASLEPDHNGGSSILIYEI